MVDWSSSIWDCECCSNTSSSLPYRDLTTNMCRQLKHRDL